MIFHVKVARWEARHFFVSVKVARQVFVQKKTIFIA